MTGRQLIRKLVDTTDNLDAEFPLFIVHRDSNDCVEFKDQSRFFQVVNGKIYVENDFDRLTS